MRAVSSPALTEGPLEPVVNSHSNNSNLSGNNHNNDRETYAKQQQSSTLQQSNNNNTQPNFNHGKFCPS